MREANEASGSLSICGDLEARIPARHPFWRIRQVVNEAVASLDAEIEALYADFGRPSIPPERLIPASLIQNPFLVRLTPEACLWHNAAYAAVTPH